VLDYDIATLLAVTVARLCVALSGAVAYCALAVGSCGAGPKEARW
jgi:hypothetical protein